jgi:hypothetical protein
MSLFGSITTAMKEWGCTRREARAFGALTTGGSRVPFLPGGLALECASDFLVCIFS